MADAWWEIIARQNDLSEESYHGCPNCRKRCREFKANTPGKNLGRPFFSCRDCKLFVWLDADRCSECGRNTFVFRNKARGWREYAACPNRCLKPRKV
jgi:hypothetical protein